MLDRTVLLPLAGEAHWHVFSTRHPAGQPLAMQALSCNPYSKGRFARPGSGLGMFYVGETEATAIWETVLQEASIDGLGFVWLHPKHLADQAVVHLARTGSEAPHCLDLRPPERYQSVNQNTALDGHWMGLLATLKPYDATHDAAEHAAQQCQAAGLTMAGIIYPSRRNTKMACVLHHPPCAQVPWIVASAPIRLDGPAGDARIADSLWAENRFTWVGDPAADPDAQPDPGAL